METDPGLSPNPGMDGIRNASQSTHFPGNPHFVSFGFLYRRIILDHVGYMFPWVFVEW